MLDGPDPPTVRGRRDGDAAFAKLFSPLVLMLNYVPIALAHIKHLIVNCDPIVLY